MFDESSSAAHLIPNRVASAYRVREAHIIRAGLINLTLACERARDRIIVQRLHPAFSVTVNDDIFAVTEHLAHCGLCTPRLVRGTAGELCIVDENGNVWRALTFVAGQSFARPVSLPMLREAGALVARFHAALDSLSYEYKHLRDGVHDLRHRLDCLDRVLAHESGHRLIQSAHKLRDWIEQLRVHLLPLDQCIEHAALRNAHGDLKFSNLLFDEAGHGLALVDLDTLARMPWPFEMGDAFRSWCNLAGEDAPQAHFSSEYLVAALEGYRAGGMHVTREERELLVQGITTIAAELGIRFLTDAIEERYFRFDAQRFPAAGEHNLLRAQGQLSLAADLVQSRGSLEREIQRVLR